jgi:GH24 family phage-related lysozyme (muramidase)
MALDPTVRDAFPRWVAQWEGVAHALYLDVHKPPLVTTAIGLMIPTLAACQRLPWQCAGRPATADEINDDWATVRSMRGGQLAEVYASKLRCRLTDDAIEAATVAQLDADVALLERRWPAFASFPQGVQQALCGMGWALGAGAQRPGLCSPEWPHLQAAIDRQDWSEAAAQCAITTSPDSRNESHRALFLAGQ